MSNDDANDLATLAALDALEADDAASESIARAQYANRSDEPSEADLDRALASME